jgi:hypothetical protein
MVGWTDDEKVKFVEWDTARKAGKLGTPLSFKTVKDLRKWLDEYKKSDKSQRITMNVKDFIKLLKERSTIEN